MPEILAILFDTISAVVLSILLIDSGISAFWKVLECT